jgi:aminoglycoside phosphotransferase family enzyme
MTLSQPDNQEEVIAFLSRPESYGLDAGVVERVETHCSIVFLVAERAYKLKRAIRYAALDYTTREKRRAACEAELRLNRRTAPELYLGTKAIGRDAGGRLVFDGAEAAVDHVVVMRRIPEADLFDRMADSGRLTPPLMHALGEAVARLHSSAEVMPDFGGSAAIGHVIADNGRELDKVAVDLDGAAIGALTARAYAALGALSGLLDRRRAEGKVRRGHGDLRLANVCLYDGRPTPFDCIEFSDEVSCIDVLYDLAFLLMDLLLRGRGDLSNVVFNAYLDLAPETEGLQALPLFLALRAATRSYALAGSARRRSDARQTARLLAQAREHIDASLGFLAPQRPVLLLLGGEDDARRTELAGLLAGLAPPAPGARVLHLAAPDEAALRLARATLAAGCSVLIEGRFAHDAERSAAAALASQCAVRIIGFWLGALPERADLGFWRPLDATYGVLAAFATAAPELAGTAVPGRSAQNPACPRAVRQAAMTPG